MRAREYTKEEVKEEFLEYIRCMINYWNRDSMRESTKEKLEGLAFSILVALDGAACGLPAFRVIPDPHPSDKEDAIDNDENWFPQAGCDIAGSLHEQFYRK